MPKTQKERSIVKKMLGEDFVFSRFLSENGSAQENESGQELEGSKGNLEPASVRHLCSQEKTSLEIPQSEAIECESPLDKSAISVL